MKRIAYFLIFTIILIACNSNKDNQSNKDATTVAPKEADMNKTLCVEFSVKGMSCEGCENTIKKHITKLDGIANVKASYVAENTVVVYDSTLTNITELENAIKDAGYNVVGHQMKAKSM